MSRDDCQFCRGARGGVRGNENIVQGIVCCDDCSVIAGRLLDNAIKKIDEWLGASGAYSSLSKRVRDKEWDKRDWPKPYLCYLCAKDKQVTRAAVRIFSGIGGGGFPACQTHVGVAEVAAIKPLSAPATSVGYRVTGYSVVEDEYGMPQLGPAMWVVEKIKNDV